MQIAIFLYIGNRKKKGLLGIELEYVLMIFISHCLTQSNLDQFNTIYIYKEIVEWLGLLDSKS